MNSGQMIVFADIAVRHANRFRRFFRLAACQCDLRRYPIWVCPFSVETPKNSNARRLSVFEL